MQALAVCVLWRTSVDSRTPSPLVKTGTCARSPRRPAHRGRIRHWGADGRARPAGRRSAAMTWRSHARPATAEAGSNSMRSSQAGTALAVPRRPKRAARDRRAHSGRHHHPCRDARHGSGGNAPHQCSADQQPGRSGPDGTANALAESDRKHRLQVHRHPEAAVLPRPRSDLLDPHGIPGGFCVVRLEVHPAACSPARP